MDISKKKAMVEKMKEFPVIDKNLSKRSTEVVQQFWETLKDELNSLGPPIKEISEWKKVWSNHKSALKKKLTNNKRQYTDTGGGENNEVLFTDLEEDVMQLVCLREAAGGVTGSRSFGTKRMRVESSNVNETSNVNKTADKDEATAESSEFWKNENLSLQKVAKVPKLLLEKEIKIQTNLYEEVAMLTTTCKEQQDNSYYYFKKISRSLERLSDETEFNTPIATRGNKVSFEKFSFEKGKVKNQILKLELNQHILERLIN